MNKIASLVKKLGAYVSGKRDLQAAINEFSARVDSDIAALVNQIDGLALDQRRFIDAFTEQVQSLTKAVNKLQLQMDDQLQRERTD